MDDYGTRRYTYTYALVRYGGQVQAAIGQTGSNLHGTEQVECTQVTSGIFHEHPVHKQAEGYGSLSTTLSVIVNKISSLSTFPCLKYANSPPATPNQLEILLLYHFLHTVAYILLSFARSLRSLLSFSSLLDRFSFTSISRLRRLD